MLGPREARNNLDCYLPLWSSLAVADLRDKGWSAKDIAHRFGVTPAYVYKWWNVDGFNPLTGEVVPNPLSWPLPAPGLDRRGWYQLSRF